MSITYECILLGTFEETVLDKVRNKLRVTCEAYDELEMRDVVLTVRAGPNTTNGRMVLSKEGESSDTNWWVIFYKREYTCSSSKPGKLCEYSEQSLR